MKTKWFFVIGILLIGFAIADVIITDKDVDSPYADFFNEHDFNFNYSNVESNGTFYTCVSFNKIPTKSECSTPRDIGTLSQKERDAIMDIDRKRIIDEVGRVFQEYLSPQPLPTVTSEGNIVLK